jgi:hypothetical protein
MGLLFLALCWVAAAQIPRWDGRAFATGLSNHQRLRARLEIEIGCEELYKRRGQGELRLSATIRDASGRQWPVEWTLPLDHVAPAPKGSILVRRADAFVLPGDYQVRFAIGDIADATRALHIQPIAGDPLPDLWRDLPAVEFVAPEDPPEAWYLPRVEALPLPVRTSAAVRVAVLVNLWPGDPVAGRRGLHEQILRALIPSLKAASQIQPSSGSLDVALLDVARQRVAFEQSGRPLEWTRLREALGGMNPNLIDAGSLEKRNATAQFFAAEVVRRAESAGEACAAIVLSPPAAFDRRQDLTPVKPRSASHCRLFYVRYDVTPPAEDWNRAPMLMPGVKVDAPLRPRRPLADELAGTIAPLEPRLFDVHSAMEFRSVLAAILGDLSGLGR